MNKTSLEALSSTEKSIKLSLSLWVTSPRAYMEKLWLHGKMS